MPSPAPGVPEGPDSRQAPGPAPAPAEGDPFAWVAAAEARIARVEEHVVYGRYLQAVAEFFDDPDPSQLAEWSGAPTSKGHT